MSVKQRARVCQPIVSFISRPGYLLLFSSEYNFLSINALWKKSRVSAGVPLPDRQKSKNDKHGSSQL